MPLKHLDRCSYSFQAPLLSVNLNRIRPSSRSCRDWASFASTEISSRNSAIFFLTDSKSSSNRDNSFAEGSWASRNIARSRCSVPISLQPRLSASFAADVSISFALSLRGKSTLTGSFRGPRLRSSDEVSSRRLVIKARMQPSKQRLVLPQESQEEMLSVNVLRSELARFVAREKYCSPGGLCITLKHRFCRNGRNHTQPLSSLNVSISFPPYRQLADLCHLESECAGFEIRFATTNCIPIRPLFSIGRSRGLSRP